MRVLVAPHHFDNLLTPDVVAEALVSGWRRAKPADQVISHPLSDGSLGFLNVVPGTQEILTTRYEGRTQPVTVMRKSEPGSDWHTVYCYTDSFLGDGITEQTLFDGDSSAMGNLLGEIIDAGAQRIVVGAAYTPWHDGGAGLLHALATYFYPEEQTPPIRTNNGELNPGTVSLLKKVRQRIAHVTIVVASAREVPLRGLHGAGAELSENPGITAAMAQEVERRSNAFVSQVDKIEGEIAQTSLLGQPQSTLLSRRSFLGAGGGVAFMLGALGAKVFPGSWVVAEETNLNESIQHVDIVITGAGVIAGDELGDGVVADIAERASNEAIPVVVVGGQIDASRRQMFKVGIHAAYPVIDTPSGRPQITARSVTDTDIQARAERIAKTWSR